MKINPKEPLLTIWNSFWLRLAKFATKRVVGENWTARVVIESRKQDEKSNH